MTPTSRGNVSIISSKMSDKPLINPNWLTTQSDIEVCIAMFKRLRDAWTVPEFKEKLTIGDEYYPGADVKTDEDIEKFIRSSMIPVSHASATCKMGKESDDMAVVDSHGKVFGVKDCEWFCPPIAPVLGSTSRRLTLK
jgi:choline dehydrogenase